MQLHTPAFESWKLAEQNALFAEHRWQILMSTGPATGSLQVKLRHREMQATRALARSLFQIAMREAADLAASLHHDTCSPIDLDAPKV